MKPKLKLGAVCIPPDYVTNNDRRVENKDGIAFIPAYSNIIFICARNHGAYSRTIHRTYIVLDLYDK